MNLNRKLLLISIFVVCLLLFVVTPVIAQNGNDDDDEKETTRFSQVISRYTNSFYYGGNVNHEHQYNFYNGMAGLIAAGRGELGGTHEGWSVRPRKGFEGYSIANNIQNYVASTANNALPGQYMRIVGGFSLRNSHGAQSGVEMAPGATGYVKDTVSVSRGDGGYFEHSNHSGTDDGRLRVQSSIEDTSSTSVDVVGFSMYHEKTVIDGGGPKTGWWDLELP
ncbi:MAG: hypothetical protein K0B84_08000 [Firmicutes bacterium]|nr:hypothetical protein [Bacillota bacterium]